MLVSEKHNFLFIHIYKNAGTSITSALSPFALSNGGWMAYKILKKLNISTPFFDPHPFPSHIKAPDIIDILGREKFASLFSFAIIRNPWDWQVSLYKYMLKEEAHFQHELVKELGSFEEYIKWRCKNDVTCQKDFIYSENNELLVNYVGRYENLESDFNKICDHIGISASLPRMNVSNTKPYQEYYTEKTKDLVRQAYELDINTFDYSF